MMAGDGLTIVNGNWGGTSLRAVRAVLESAEAVLCAAFEKCADAPIRVARWSQDPQVFHDRRAYEIRISARDTYWCQYVYQFSHELCHVLVNFDRARGHRHKWFEESLCELAALFVLHRLPEAWKDRPPPEVAGAAEFAPHFRTYADDVAAAEHGSGPRRPSGVAGRARRSPGSRSVRPRAQPHRGDRPPGQLPAGPVAVAGLWLAELAGTRRRTVRSPIISTPGPHTSRNRG